MTSKLQHSMEKQVAEECQCHVTINVSKAQVQGISWRKHKRLTAVAPRKKSVTEGPGRRLLNYTVFGNELICLTEIETRMSEKKKVKLKK